MPARGENRLRSIILSSAGATIAGSSVGKPGIAACALSSIDA